MKMNFLELDRRRIPVVRIFFDDDNLVLFPLGEKERSIADEVSGQSPSVAALIDFAEFLNRRQMHRKPRVMRQHRKKIRRRSAQLNLERAVVERSETNLVEIF